MKGKMAKIIKKTEVAENNLSKPKSKDKISLLKPTWQRLVLSLLIVLVLLSIFITTKSMDKSLGDYSCRFLDLSRQFNEARNKTDNESLNRIMSETKTIQQEMADKVQSNRKIYNYAIKGNLFLAKIDPIYPVDCAFVPLNKFCSFYISEENYGCSKSVIEEQARALKREIPELPAYKPVNYIILIINLAIFFIIGYLISFLVALAYKKSKIKVNISKD